MQIKRKRSFYELFFDLFGEWHGARQKFQKISFLFKISRESYEELLSAGKMFHFVRNFAGCRKVSRNGKNLGKSSTSSPHFPQRKLREIDVPRAEGKCIKNEKKKKIEQYLHQRRKEKPPCVSRERRDCKLLIPRSLGHE